MASHDRVTCSLQGKGVGHTQTTRWRVEAVGGSSHQVRMLSLDGKAPATHIDLPDPIWGYVLVTLSNCLREMEAEGPGTVGHELSPVYRKMMSMAEKTPQATLWCVWGGEWTGRGMLE